MASEDGPGRPRVRVSESEDFALSTTETVVVSGEGGVSCDVWVRIPTSWKTLILIELYGTVGTVRTRLAAVSLTDVIGTTSAGYFHANALRVRGRPCDGFEVAASYKSGSPTGMGRVVLQVFDSDMQAIIEQVRPPDGSAAAPFRQLSQIQPLPRVDASVTSVTTSESDSFTASGATDCDVWVRVPSSWKPNLEVVLYGQVGNVAVELARVTTADSQGTTSGSFWSGVVIASRGRRCDSFKVTLRSTSGSTLTGSASLSIQPADVGAPAAVRQSEAILPAVRSAPIAITTSEVVVATAGPGTGCDVWVKAPNGWSSDSARVRLYGTVGGVRVRLAESTLARGPQGAINGTIERIPLTYRGRACGSFEATLEWTTTGAPSGTGIVVLQPTTGAVLPRAEGDTLPDGSALAPLHQRIVEVPPLRRHYAATVGSSTTGISASGLVGYLWNGGALPAYVTRVTINARVGSGPGLTLIAQKNGSTEPTGGTSVTAFESDISLPTPSATGYHLGATGSTSGGVLFRVDATTADFHYVWEPPPGCAPLLIHPTTSPRGLRISATTLGTTSTFVNVTFEWYEE